jgi:hypothetical protein
VEAISLVACARAGEDADRRLLLFAASMAAFQGSTLGDDPIERKKMATTSPELAWLQHAVSAANESEGVPDEREFYGRFQ